MISHPKPKILLKVKRALNAMRWQRRAAADAEWIRGRMPDRLIQAFFFLPKLLINVSSGIRSKLRGTLYTLEGNDTERNAHQAQVLTTYYGTTYVLL